MKTNVRLNLTWFIAGILLISSAALLTNCKGKVEIFDVTDSVENCSPPFVVYFYPEAEHRTKDLEYTWEFGDGTTAHDMKPVHIFEDYGTYPVRLTIKQKDAVDEFNYVLNLTEEATVPKAIWDYASLADSLWAPAYVEFQNYSEFATSFLWEFGDGETSISEEPHHVYETPGVYTTLLNAICVDTAKMAMNMIIKDPPDKIDVFDVTVWMPDTYLGSDVWVNIWYSDHNEDESALATNVTSFPITFEMTHTLFWFNGDFNSDLLEFEIWSSFNDGDPEKIFSVESRSLQLEYYPTLLYRKDGYGFAFEARLGYRD